MQDIECFVIVKEYSNLTKEMMNNYNDQIRNYNKLLLVVFRWLKKAESSQIKFDDPNFVDNEIKRLEYELL